MASSAEAVAEWRRRKLGTEPPYHGTTHIYNSYGCRCDPCRLAATIGRRKYGWR